MANCDHYCAMRMMIVLMLLLMLLLLLLLMVVVVVVVVVVEVVEVVDGSGGGRFAGFMTVYEKESYRKAKDKWQHDIPRAFPMSNVHLSSYLILSPRCSRVYRPIHPQMPPMHWSLYFTKYRRSKRVHFTSFSAL